MSIMNRLTKWLLPQKLDEVQMYRIGKILSNRLKAKRIACIRNPLRYCEGMDCPFQEYLSNIMTIYSGIGLRCPFRSSQQLVEHMSIKDGLKELQKQDDAEKHLTSVFIHGEGQFKLKVKREEVMELEHNFCKRNQESEDYFYDTLSCSNIGHGYDDPDNTSDISKIEFIFDNKKGGTQPHIKMFKDLAGMVEGTFQITNFDTNDIIGSIELKDGNVTEIGQQDPGV